MFSTFHLKASLTSHMHNMLVLIDEEAQLLTGTGVGMHYLKHTIRTKIEGQKTYTLHIWINSRERNQTYF